MYGIFVLPIKLYKKNCGCNAIAQRTHSITYSCLRNVCAFVLCTTCRYQYLKTVDVMAAKLLRKHFLAEDTIACASLVHPCCLLTQSAGLTETTGAPVNEMFSKHWGLVYHRNLDIYVTSPRWLYGLTERGINHKRPLSFASLCL